MTSSASTLEFLIGAVLVLIACVVLAYVIAYGVFGRRTLWLDPHRRQLKAFRCTACDGCGVQWLDPRDNVWKPIPPELRVFSGNRQSIVVDELRFPEWLTSNRVAFNTNSRLANVRTCRNCNGLLHVWDYAVWRKEL